MLTSLTEEDRDLILPWRNAPEVRRAMYSQHEITEEEHRAWFMGVSADPAQRWLLFKNSAETALGVVYYTKIDPSSRSAFWGFYAKPRSMKGVGLLISFDALNFGFGEMGLEEINCEVLASNKSCLNMNKTLGFSCEGKLRKRVGRSKKVVDSLSFRITATQWAARRENLGDRLSQSVAFQALASFGG